MDQDVFTLEELSQNIRHRFPKDDEVTYLGSYLELFCRDGISLFRKCANGTFYLPYDLDILHHYSESTKDQPPYPPQDVTVVDELVGLKEQLERLDTLWRHCANQKTSNSAILYGLHGLGKSSVCEKTVSRLSHLPNQSILHLNCIRDITTSSHFLTQIVYQITSQKSTSPQDALDVLEQYLKTNPQTTHVLFLDEIDGLSKRDARWLPAMFCLADVNRPFSFFIVGITNTLNMPEFYQPNVQCPTMIPFPMYSAKTLEKILLAHMGDRLGVYPDKFRAFMCRKISSIFNGDVRKMISHVTTTLCEMEAEHKTSVEMKHIHQATDRLKQYEMQQFEWLDLDLLMILGALLTFDTPATTVKLEHQAANLKDKLLKKRTICDFEQRMKQLEKLNFIDCKTNHIKLMVDAKQLEEAIGKRSTHLLDHIKELKK